MSYAEFNAIRIGIASPEQIREWSYGEVKKPETINYRTLKPERDGLFCERIFGPTKDWECHCGKYKKIRFKGKVCDRCGVEVTRAKVRRERMGHIELAAPVSHIWYFKGIPSRMGLLLDISPRILEKVLYFASYIVTDPGPDYTHLTKNQILSDAEYRKLREYYEDDFQAGMGAEAVKKLLQDLDLEQLSESLRAQLKDATGQKKAKIVKRLEVVDAFRLSGNKPEWMIIDVLPVIPPELRPMVQLDGGRFATSDLNDLYRRVINRNNRLKRLIQLNAPDIIVRNEKRMLQEAVDALIDNGRRGRAVTGANNRALKSLSDLLKGKQGRFRQNLLGKRVDYSGRSVIVVGPELKIYQCGVPKEMAIELFRPFVMKKLVEDGHANNIKSAKKMVDKASPAVWDALEFVIKEHPVMLNRAPTLHRLGIQAFEPVLVEGRAMKLHPLVCTAFNADFDGDQMAIHVPLSAEAQAEARILMLAANNLLKPSDGGAVAVPTQDMVLGSYYLTYERDPEHDPDCAYETTADAAAALERGEVSLNDRIWVRDEEANRWYRTTPALCAEAVDGKAREVYQSFESDQAAKLAYDEGELDLHEPILVRRSAELDGVTQEKMVLTTVGRLIFNEGIPQDLGFVDRTDPDKAFDPEINFVCGKKQLGKIVDKCIEKHGFTVSATVLDTIKARGYKFSTRGSLTVAIADMTVPPQKAELIANTEKEVVKIENQYKRGFLTNEERYRLVVSAWEKTTADVSDALQKGMDRYNPIFMMADSGARGSAAQIRQLAGMRGLMADTSGRTIEIPIKANFREGLSVLEYFISSRGARKGMADTALRTADSGYLTRRLVDVSQEVIIREEDCGTHDGITVFEISENGQVIEPLHERLRGRYLCEDFKDFRTGEVLVGHHEMVSADQANLIEAKLREQAEAEGDPDRKVSIKVRSVLTCEARNGVCAKCYGMNMAFGEPVGQGEAVGIIAAQSIGEPGTQLTMRTFHTGGVAGGDITQGLPRVEELFEARKPKKMAQLAEISGTVSMEEAKRATLCNVTITADDGEVVTYAIPYSAGIRVKAGDKVVKGQELTDGALSPHDVLRVRGVDAVHNYLIQEVQKPYRQQGVDINDKHIEVIARQMMRKVRVEDAGDSTLLSGSTVDIIEYKDAYKAVEARIAAGEKQETGEELRLPTCTRLLLGITKASLATESFLSAASFQETTKVLTEAAIKGKVDHLLGLKENVIIGKLIPAGSGLAAYRKYDQIEDEMPQEGRFDAVNAAAEAAREAEEPQVDDVEDTQEGVEEDEILSISIDE
ncbi:DNA-directed RNA polymerase subunit beta' [Pseudoflavonifractor sp. An85]|uniref:DNA-directed RNA polymerase subunit beta' n=1 Tax=Pseudoflavonifractor sp. An85 TaxID=1965661 RepID=UPI000B389A6A|nr:DNA-directed RNA polymerase subunit beta' [Pseudoflavonifractor sp. An85]OUN25544.1 DNA-directed RNA polymerase subunit beta' [Pseudoflavonifractor sp. An85]